MTSPVPSDTDRLAEVQAAAAVPDDVVDIAVPLLNQLVSGHLDAAHEYVENDNGAVEDYSPHPASIESDARAIVAAVTPILLAQLQGRLDTAEGQLAKWKEIHKPERRYTPDDGETSYATYFEAADDYSAGSGTPPSVTFFEICSHCASLEMAEGCEHDYKESLWPCKDAEAAGLGEGDGE